MMNNDSIRSTRAAALFAVVVLVASFCAFCVADLGIADAENMDGSNEIPNVVYAFPGDEFDFTPTFEGTDSVVLGVEGPWIGGFNGTVSDAITVTPTDSDSDGTNDKFSFTAGNDGTDAEPGDYYVILTAQDGVGAPQTAEQYVKVIVQSALTMTVDGGNTQTINTYVGATGVTSGPIEVSGGEVKSVTLGETDKFSLYYGGKLSFGTITKDMEGTYTITAGTTEGLEESVLVTVQLVVEEIEITDLDQNYYMIVGQTKIWNSTQQEVTLKVTANGGNGTWGVTQSNGQNAPTVTVGNDGAISIELGSASAGSYDFTITYTSTTNTTYVVEELFTLVVEPVLHFTNAPSNGALVVAA